MTPRCCIFTAKRLLSISALSMIKLKCFGCFLQQMQTSMLETSSMSETFAYLQLLICFCSERAALHLASLSGDLEFCRLLIESNANLDARDIK